MGYGSRYRKKFIALCNQLRPQSSAVQLPTTSPETKSEVEAETNHEVETEMCHEVENIVDQRAPSCPKCGQPMHPISETPRPSWRDLFYGPAHRAWFES